jgi:nucleoside-diphosphate-sugar epimerase
MKDCILITGGSGFIGSNLVEFFIKEGFRIKVIDNLSTGKIENIKEFLKEIEFYNADITNLNLLREVMEGVNFILHNAALPSVIRSFKDPYSTIITNIIGTQNIIQAAIEYKVKKIIFASSSSVYGDVEKLPMNEIYYPKPLSPYALTKLAGEYLMKIYGNIYSIETVSLRYFNVFGPKQNPLSEYAAVIPKFIHNILEEKEVVIYGDGYQSRDFTYVDNVVYANYLALTKHLPNGIIINIACGENYNLHDLINIISKILNKNVKIKYEPPRKGEIRNSLADISLAKEVLNYEPKIKFSEGIARTIEWFKNIRISTT